MNFFFKKRIKSDSFILNFKILCVALRIKLKIFYTTGNLMYSVFWLLLSPILKVYLGDSPGSSLGALDIPGSITHQFHHFPAWTRGLRPTAVYLSPCWQWIIQVTDLVPRLCQWSIVPGAQPNPSLLSGSHWKSSFCIIIFFWGRAWWFE